MLFRSRLGGGIVPASFYNIGYYYDLSAAESTLKRKQRNELPEASRGEWMNKWAGE